MLVTTQETQAEDRAPTVCTVILVPQHAPVATPKL